MEKYYVPGIEDIKIGYQCEFTTDGLAFEVGNTDDIITGKLGISEVVFLVETLYELGMEDELSKHVRTPYLTKEQIEKEGWEFRKTNKVRWWYEKPFEVCFGGIPMSPAHKYWEIQLMHDPEYAAIKISAKISDDTLSDIFEGKCPSINEFRFIQKLLQIK
jgi:hypothetical protein